jgi:hypothetical protein
MTAPEALAVIAAVNLAAGVFVRYRWQAMCKAPVAFPAGRFAR